MKIVVFNLGCKVNQYESDVLAGRLRALNHEVSEELVYADLYVINTCAVTAEAEKKSRQAVARVKKLNPDAKIFICGCASQNKPDSFTKDGVVYIGGTFNKERVLDLEYGGVCVAAMPTKYEDYGNAVSPRTRSYVKVQDGCNNFCSYCLVPYMRGRERSRSIESAVQEVRESASVCKEVVLTGINLSAFGKDTGTSLAQLIAALSDVDVRIRLGSLEVGVVDGVLLDALSRLKAFCPHFHLSLQSGCDETLKAMNRHYTSAEYAEKVALIRERFPDAAITTDIIAGFPTETEEQFEISAAFAESIGFSDIHAFGYSRREGTAAARFKPLSPDTVKARTDILLALKAKLRYNYCRRFIDEPLEVLFEEYDGEYTSGYSRNYIRVYTVGDHSGELCTVVPTEGFRDGLKA